MNPRRPKQRYCRECHARWQRERRSRQITITFPTVLDKNNHLGIMFEVEKGTPDLSLEFLKEAKAVITSHLKI